jgi:hypothetical protein
MKSQPSLALLLVLLFSLSGCLSPFSTGDDDDAAGDDDDGAGDDDDAADDDDATGDDDDATGDDDDDATTPSGPLVCSPGTTQLALSQGSPQTVQFSATVDLGNGPEPANNVEWSIVDGPGSIATFTGLYTSSSDVGGLAEILAYLDGETAICTVEMTMDGTDNVTGNSAVPSGFSGATVQTNDSCAAELLYPLEDSVMPASFQAPLIQWDAAGHNMHMLEIASAWTTITVYTSADEYQPAQDVWNGLTIYDPADTVTLTLTSGTWNGTGFSGSVCTSSTSTTFEVTDGSLNGTIVYWEPPITKAISFDAVGGTQNSTVQFAAAVCHGCHTVNLANPMRMTYGPDFPGTTALIDLANPGTILQQWGGFFPLVDYGAPDNTGAYVVVGESGFTGSLLKLKNANTGAEVGVVTTSKSAAMPNWSPDGSKIVYVGCDGAASALEAAECDLFTQDWNPTTQTFSNETEIASHASGETLYYPSFSPDSQWVAYNRATPVLNSDGEENWSNANPTADMMLVSASGGAQILLSQANGVGDLTNSWPRWAPVTANYAWLAVSSKRPYGHTVDNRSQLWVTGIDFSIAATGADPSRPPAWIPGQLTSAGNHTPTWLPRFAQ